jgi:quercetin dioxygenase-like cupin family protein
MAIPHAQPGELMDARPLGAALSETQTHTLIKTSAAELIRMVLPAGKELKEHRAPGEIIVHCLEGRVEFTTMGKTEELTPGKLLLLPPAEPHAVRALEDSSFLLTILFPADGSSA